MRLTRRHVATAELVPVSPFLAALAASAAAVEEEPPSRPSLLRRARGWLWVRRQSHGIPAALISGVGAGGILVQGWPWWLVAVLGWVAVTAVWARASHRHHTHAVISAAAGAAWLVVASLPEVLSPVNLIGLLVAGGVALAAPFTARYGRRRPVLEVAATPSGPRSHPSQVWDDFIACSDGCLPGSRLVDVESVPGGRAGRIVLRGGKQHTSSAVGAKPMIASAFAEVLGLTAAQIEVEPGPSGLPNEARLLLLDSVTLLKPQPWRGPTLSLASAGAMAIARFGDAARALVHAFELGSGGVNMLIAGVPGAGKTMAVVLVLVEAAWARFRDVTGRERPLIGTVYCDGKGGQSIPEAAQSPGIAWAATWPQECARAILAFERDVQARKRYLSTFEWTDPRGRVRRGMSYFDPVVAQLPYMQLVIEEWPKLWREYEWMVDRVMRIATTCRSLGMRVVLVCQAVDAEEVGAANLRAMVAAGAAVVFRTNDKTTAGMMFAGQMEVDPSSLPRDMPGAAFVKGPQQRNAMARGLIVDDPFGWLSTAPEWELGDVDMEAMGEDLALAAARRAFWEEHGLDVEEAPELWAPILAEYRGVPVEEVLAELVGMPGDSAPVAVREVSLPELIVKAVTALCADSEDAGRADVLRWIGEYATATGGKGWSERTIGDALAKAADTGAIVKPKHGRYAPVGESVAA